MRLFNEYVATIFVLHRQLTWVGSIILMKNFLLGLIL